MSPHLGIALHKEAERKKGVGWVRGAQWGRGIVV